MSETPEQRKEWLRPSMLPKLAKCTSYRSEANAGPAADRGTRIDAATRAALMGQPIDRGAFPPEDLEAIEWTVAAAKALAGEHALEAREEHLRVEALGLTGTADLSCEGAFWSADQKTGQLRDYLEQQALYALGFMDLTFSDEWTAYLLFCDQREVVTLRFTRESAEREVRAVLARVAGEEPPTPNEYCGWCALRWTCAARREAIGIRPLDGDGAVVLDDLASPALRDFVLRAGVVADFAEKAREILLGRIMGGEKVPGCSAVSKRGARKVLVRFLVANMKKLGAGVLELLFKDVSESKLLPIVEEKMPGATIPPEDVLETPGSTYLRVGKPKAG